MSSLRIGYLLRASTAGFTVGCSVSQLELPTFGALVRAPLGNSYQVYGLIHDIHIDDDGLVRQLVTAGNVSEEIIRDNRERRTVPVEMSVLTVGYEEENVVRHLLPPRPPLSLDVIHLCTAQEIARFLADGRFGYFRLILRARDLPLGELLASHLLEVKRATGRNDWVEAATRELIVLLRDDYATLMSVLGALGEVVV